MDRSGTRASNGGSGLVLCGGAIMRSRVGAMRRRRRESLRQGVFTFQARRDRRERLFRRLIVAVTGLALAGLLVAMAPRWTSIGDRARATKWKAMRRIGLEPDRREIDASLRKRRARLEIETRDRYRSLFAQAHPRAAGVPPGRGHGARRRGRPLGQLRHDLRPVVESLRRRRGPAVSAAAQRALGLHPADEHVRHEYLPVHRARDARGAQARPRPRGPCPWPGRSRRPTPGAAAGPSPT